MAQIIVTSGAARGLERCRQFLVGKNPLAAQRAAAEIRAHLDLLVRHPDCGRPLAEMPELRELLIPFGDSGYVALYRHDASRSTVFLLAFRHQKEAGY